MCSSIHDEIDALALEIERTIAQNEDVLAEYEEPEPASEVTGSGPMSAEDMSLFS